MTIREVQCLLMLYQACRDEALCRRAEALVPELTEIGGTLAFNGTTRRRRLTAHDGHFQRFGERFIVCSDADLEEHKRDYARSFDLAVSVTIDAEDA